MPMNHATRPTLLVARPGKPLALRFADPAAFDALYRQAGMRTHRWEQFCGDLARTPVGPDGRKLGQVPGDGNVFDHQLTQARLVGQFGRLDVGSPALALAAWVAVSSPGARGKIARMIRSAVCHSRSSMDMRSCALMAILTT